MDRRRAIEEAVHNAEMDGACVSAEFAEDMRCFVDGNMDLNEMMRRALQRNDHRDDE
ncbi:antitoxin VbhA family protein [Bifidobacterium sp. SO1]|uniref:antitoxin VbhA family protein n=1 Tax=Bifidobacterium sp. SO1 TaxID=2809029 RepID=UPI001BDC4AE9|nr:antitoxin VbhA family protein [Bifidobacterium sp. SO1]MBT1161794.1 hypothetical protein [Bifidobacterium sp. SO1]